MELCRLLLVEACHRPKDERPAASTDVDLAQALFQVHHPGPQGVRVHASGNVEQAETRGGEVEPPDQTEDFLDDGLAGR